MGIHNSNLRGLTGAAALKEEIKAGETRDEKMSEVADDDGERNGQKIYTDGQDVVHVGFADEPEKGRGNTAQQKGMESEDYEAGGTELAPCVEAAGALADAKGQSKVGGH